jgi:hypothetical protein
MNRRPLAIRTTSWVFALLWAWTLAASQIVRPYASEERLRADVSADVQAAPAVRATIESQSAAARHRAPGPAGHATPVAILATPLLANAGSATQSSTAASDRQAARPRRLAFRYDATAPPATL